MQKLNATLEQSKQATEKMNELADNFILARNIFVGSLAFYATFSLVRKFIVKPFIKTFKFLSNQTKNLQVSLQKKFDDGIVVVTGSTTGLGPQYAKYLARLGFPVIILIDSEEAALSKQKTSLLKAHNNSQYKLKVYTIKNDLKQRQAEVNTVEEKLNCDVLKQIRALALKFSDKQISIIVNNMAQEPNAHETSNVKHIQATTNHIIENVAMITKYCTTDLKSEMQFMLGTAVVNVGTHTNDIGQKEKTFKDEDEET